MRYFVRVSAMILVAQAITAPLAALSQIPQVASAQPTAAPASLLDRPVTIQLSNASLKIAVQAIARQAGVRVYYQVELVDEVQRPVSVRAVKVPLGTVLSQALAGTGLIPVVTSADGVTLQATGVTTAVTDGIITGKVIRATTQEPMVGATVSLVGTKKSAVTDENGTFRIEVAPGDYTVQVRHLGTVQQKRTVALADGQTITLEFALEQSRSVLNEVIVTGTVVATERRAVPNPITVITAEEIEQRGITRIEQFFRGEVPGVYAKDIGTSTYYDGITNSTQTHDAMASSEIYVRGSSNLGRYRNAGPESPGQPNPLKTYVDGVEILDPSYLGTIDPASIERIEIITGPQAATVYGSGAMGGVMQIFTKRGIGTGKPEATVSLKYGVLQSSFSSGWTPAHNHTVNLSGMANSSLNYSGNLSYNYTGQWQPALFSRRVGASLGVRYAQNSIAINGSLNVASGRNGTHSGTLTRRSAIESGEDRVSSISSYFSRRVSTMSSQTVSLSADYRPGSFWSHQVAIGRNNTALAMIPESPQFRTESDSLYRVGETTGERMTASYNVTFLPARFGVFSSTLTVGANGAWGNQTRVNGCILSKVSTAYTFCTTSTSTMSVTKPLSTKSWGGFASWQAGIFDHLYFTFGLRGEQNPNYGRDHAVDWTPTNGATVVMDLGQLTVKLLGSYGRATRPPLPDQRLAETTVNGNFAPSTYLLQYANPDLTPEYSRGPQGGIELYYGNLATLTVNRFRQTVSDLIQRIAIDSLTVLYTRFDGFVFPDYRTPQWQYRNEATIRQHGWETTGSLNLARLSFRGTYSWTDSRVVKMNMTDVTVRTMYPGMSFSEVPTHTGNISISYAYDNTTVRLVRNFTGQRSLPYSRMKYFNQQSRIDMYLERRRWDFIGAQFAIPGYGKSDAVVMHRLSPWVTATLNVTNLGNSFDSDTNGTAMTSPSLGRQTLLGISLRFR